VPASRKRGDGERFRPVSSLRATSENKGQPVCRDRGMKERYSETSDGDGRKQAGRHAMCTPSMFLVCK